MTISSEVRKAGPFSGNGSATSFPFDFKIFSAGDLAVYLTDPSGAESVLGGSDYTVRMNADQESAPGGTVVKNTPLAAGYALTITSKLPYLQPVRLTNQGGFYPEVINTALDRLTVFAQQLAEQVGRAVKIKISDSVTPEQLLDGIKADTAAAKGAAAAAAGSASAAGASESAAAGHAQTAQAAASNAQQQAQAAHGSAEVARQAVETIANVGGITPTEADARYVPKSHLSDGDPHSQYLPKVDARQVAMQAAGEVIDTRLAGGTWHLNDRSRVIQGVDLNTVVEPGVYRYTAGNAANVNAPADGPQWGVMEVIQSHGFVTQIIHALYNVSDGGVWVRSWDARSSNTPGVSGWRRLHGDWLPRVLPVLARVDGNNAGGSLGFDAAPNQPYGKLLTDYEGSSYRIYAIDRAGGIPGGVYLNISRLTNWVQPVLADAPVTFTGAAPVYGARAWGSFTYVGALNVSLYALGNVSSVTAPSSGVVTVNFITPMQDVAYAVVFHAQNSPNAYISSRLAGGFTISGLAGNSGLNFSVFR